MEGLILTGPPGTVFNTPQRISGRASLTEIKVKVCVHFKVSTKEIEGKRRSRRISWPRMLAMCLSREIRGDQSLPAIAHRYNRDHTTVLHACRRIAELREEIPEFDEHYRALKMQLGRE